MYYKWNNMQCLLSSTALRACLLLGEATERGQTWHQGKASEAPLCTLKERREDFLLGLILKGSFFSMWSNSTFILYCMFQLRGGFSF